METKPQVFIAPSKDCENITKSVINGVNPKLLPIEDKDLLEKIQLYYENGLVRLWGVSSSMSHRWGTVERGDYLLFYCEGKLVAVGRALFKYPWDPSNGRQRKISYSISRTVWGNPNWPNLIFLIDVKKINLSREDFLKLINYDKWPVLGFTRIAKEEVRKKLLKYLRRKVYRAISKKQKEGILGNYMLYRVYKLGAEMGYRPEWVNKEEGPLVAWFPRDSLCPSHVFIMYLGDVFYTPLSDYEPSCNYKLVILTRKELRAEVVKILEEKVKDPKTKARIKLIDVESVL